MLLWGILLDSLHTKDITTEVDYIHYDLPQG